MMATASMMTMPMLILNMGSEMIYVLDQRLRAQKVPREKSTKVLDDLLRALHREDFIAEAFRPQSVHHTNAALRQVFDKLAHSSIMKLNSNSMDKLYELMRMGFKHQLLMCASADEILQVTMNHLTTTKGLTDCEKVRSLIDESAQKVTQTYGPMLPGDMFVLKQELLLFFQDARVKVSLFLQTGVQEKDGTIILRSDGNTASGGRKPGRVCYFDDQGRKTKEDSFFIASAQESTTAPTGHILKRDPVHPYLGCNIYNTENRGVPIAPKPSDNAMASAGKSDGVKAAAMPQKQFKATGSDGLNLLASLVGTGATKASAKDQTDSEGHKAFRFNLFPEDDSSKAKDNDEDPVPTIWIDASSDPKQALGVVHDFDEAKLDKKKTRTDDDTDDLLVLMDTAIRSDRK